jgi:hypothetical protein
MDIVEVTGGCGWEEPERLPKSSDSAQLGWPATSGAKQLRRQIPIGRFIQPASLFGSIAIRKKPNPVFQFRDRGRSGARSYQPLLKTAVIPGKNAFGFVTVTGTPVMK